MHSLQAMAIHGKLDGAAILEDWSNVTREDSQIRTQQQQVQSLPFPFVRPRDPLGEYRRGVRRDPNAFVFLKEDKEWDSWEQSTVAKA
jgi:hypothetical protein